MHKEVLYHFRINFEIYFEFCNFSGPIFASVKWVTVESIAKNVAHIQVRFLKWSPCNFPVMAYCFVVLIYLNLPDHLPVICEVRSIPKTLPYTRKISKRCLRNFSKEKWNECLEKEDWSDLENCNSVDDMADIFTANIVYNSFWC